MSLLRRLPAKIVHHEKGGFHLYVNPYSGRKFVTDFVGARVIELMNSSCSEEELAERISKELSINPYEAAARLISFAEKLTSQGMFDSCEPTSKGLPNPNLGFLEVTRQCSTRCRLCYVDSGTARPDTLKKEEIFDIVDEMADMGITFVALSGGDPLTRDDLVEILEYIAEKKHLTPGLSTSLLTLTEELARRLKDLGALVQVSLDGSNPAVNDWNRGQGSFEKAMKGVELLSKFGVPFRFAYVINKHNLHDVEEMVELARKVGALEVTFGKVKMAGRAKGQESEAYPESEAIASAYFALYRKAFEMAGKKLKVSCKHNQPLITGLEDRVGELPCGAGRTFVQVCYNGDVIPCSLLSDIEEFVLGNVRKERLEKIWRTSPILEFFRSTSVEDLEVCRDCPAKYLCGGGCRADAYRMHGSLTAACSDCKDLVFYYNWILDRGCNEKKATLF